MVHFKDRYKVESFCGKCGEWTPEPTHKPIYGNYGYIIAVREHHEYPRVYDDKGNTYDLQTLIPIKQINRRGLDGTLFEEIREFRSPVKCQYCGKICRSGPLSKTKYNEAKEKTVHRIDKVGIDDVFGKPKVEPINSKVELIKPTLPERVRLAKDNPDLNPRGRPKGSRINKEEIDYYADLIKKSKNTMFEVEYILKQEKPSLYKKVRKKLEKENEGKEDSHVT